MNELPQALLTSALHLKWDGMILDPSIGADHLAARLPGYSPEQYAAAIERAVQFDNAVYDRASAWFANQGQEAWPDRTDLEREFPGFAHEDYYEAVNNNILWARK